MNKVIACIEGASAPSGLCDYAAWAALRLDAPLEFLHVLDRHPEIAPVTDYSGSIGIGTQETLLAQLGALDEERSKLATQHGRLLLEEARRRAAAAGVLKLDARQRHGTLIETLLDMQPDTRLLVMGQRHHLDNLRRIHLDHNVERVVRTVLRPVLVASPSFKSVERFAIAFDGSNTGRKMVQTVAQSPLLAGLPCDILMVAEDSAASQVHLQWALTTLADKGSAVQPVLLKGDPDAVILEHVKNRAVDLLVMGAYGHSRIRQLIVGSTTTTLLRMSPIPVLVLR